MIKTKQILDYISTVDILAATVDFLAVLIAIFSLSLCLAAGATWLNPKRFNEFYLVCFSYSVATFTVSYLILKPLEYLFLSKLPVNLIWLFVITLGSFGFTCFLFSVFFGKKLPPAEIFIGFLLLALIPAAIFRFTVNFAISFWQERKEKPISIVN